MDTVFALKFISAFVFVMALMVLLSWVLKRTGMSSGVMQGTKNRRLKTVEYLAVDSRRRLVLIRRDDREHLLLLGSGSETVVETNIPIRNNDVEDQKNVQV